jgi:hypothetical protein
MVMGYSKFLPDIQLEVLRKIRMNLNSMSYNWAMIRNGFLQNKCPRHYHYETAQYV